MKLNIEFDHGADIILSPFLGKLRENTQSHCVQSANVVAPELTAGKPVPLKAGFATNSQLVVSRPNDIQNNNLFEQSIQRQGINRLDQLVRPGVDGNSNLAWKDLWWGVDVLAGDGAPRYMLTRDF